MAEHKHGDMNVADHEKTFAAFIKYSTWTAIWIIVLLILMAIFIA